MRGGDRAIQSAFEVTGAAKKVLTFATGEAREPFDIIIQNTHATAVIYVNLSGDATVSDTMLKVSAGGTLRLENIINEVSVIGSVPSNTVPLVICRAAGKR